MARPACAVRAVEDNLQQVVALEYEEGLRRHPRRVRQGRRRRIEHRGFFLRESPPALGGRCVAAGKGAQNQCIGRSRGGLTTKIHALVDGLGNPTHVHLTPGNVHDVVEAPRLIEAAHGQNFIGDSCYDADAVIEAAEAKGMNAVIPPKSNRKHPRKVDFHLYKERHLVECFFNRLKQFRRVATRYEKTARNSPKGPRRERILGFVLVASIKVWLA